jgi:hypothetical protein
MRFVPTKTEDQQARTVLFQARTTVRQLTEFVNALRAVLYEYGQVIPLGIGHVKRIEAIVEDAEIDCPSGKSAATFLLRSARRRPGSTKGPRSLRHCPGRAMSPAGFRRCRVWGR